MNSLDSIFSMAEPEYTIRPLSLSELPLAIDWAASEGWNPGLHDADCFHAADPEGFLVGELNGEPVATISAVKYGASFGFVGFYIVKPEYRGRGYAMKIWNAALERLAGRNVGLDGVVSQQGNYAKSGFTLAYRNIRYEGVTGGEPVNAPNIILISDVPFEAVARYDRPFFPDDRARFLASWLRQPESVALGIMRDEQLSGYGMIRVCRTGYKVGPLFADTPGLAEKLFLALQSRVEPGKPFYLDVPEVNRDAVALAEKHHMSVVFETARMYTGAFPDTPLDRVYGVTSFELG